MEDVAVAVEATVVVVQSKQPKEREKMTKLTKVGGWLGTLAVVGMILKWIIIPLVGAGIAWASDKLEGDGDPRDLVGSYEIRHKDGSWGGKFDATLQEKSGKIAISLKSHNYTSGEYQRTVVYIPAEGGNGVYQTETLWNNKVVEEGVVESATQTQTGGWEFKIIPTNTPYRSYEARFVLPDEFGF